MSWQMVKHAFAMVFGNLVQALKVSIAPILLAIALVYVIFTVFGLDVGNMMAMSQMNGMNGAMPMDMEAPGGGFFIAVILAFLVYLFMLSWIAVAWHRFILLEEYPGFMPSLHGGTVASYMGKTVLIGILLFIVIFVLGLVVGLVIGAVAMGTNDMNTTFALGLVTGLIIGSISAWFWFRLAISLPGTAVGKPMGIGEAWRATAPWSGKIFGMVLILVAINLIATAILSYALMGLPQLILAILNLIVTWITLMVGASMLTTLYGHLVEGRPLSD